MRKHVYTAEEEAIIRRDYKTKGYRQLASELGLSERTITAYCSRHKLRKHAERSPELDRKVCEMYHTHTMQSICNELHLSNTFVKNTIARYKVKRTPEEKAVLGEYRHLPRKRRSDGTSPKRVRKNEQWGLTAEQKMQIRELIKLHPCSGVAKILGLKYDQVRYYLNCEKIDYDKEAAAQIREQNRTVIKAEVRPKLTEKKVTEIHQKATAITPWREDDKARARELELQIDDLDVQLDNAKTVDEMLALQRRMSVLVAQLRNLTRKPDYKRYVV